MYLIQLVCILSIGIAFCSTNPIQVSTSTTSTVSTNQHSKSTTKGLINPTTISPIKGIQVPNNLIIERRSTENPPNNAKTNALYQMANSLLQKEKNWLQTEKWLIDNVYRLKNELGDIKRELSDQKKLNLLLSQKAISTQNQQLTNDQIKNVNFMQDISSLRADHSLISQQQQQIAQIVKDNQQQLLSQTGLLKQLTTMVKDQFKSVASISQAMVSLQQINDSQANGSTNQLISKLMYDLSALSSTSSSTVEKLSSDADKLKANRIQQRSVNPGILKLIQAESQFEGHAEHKLGQLSQEIQSLHSMTLNLSKSVADLQKKSIRSVNEKK